MKDERKTIQEVQQQKTEKVIKKVLSADYINFFVEKVNLNENLIKGISQITCHVKVGNRSIKISNKGKGLVDALYSGFIQEFSDDCESLKDIKFVDFRIKIADKKKQSDAHVIAKIVVKNSSGEILIFSDKSRSMNASAIRVVSKAIEYFINSEKAFLLLQVAIKDAKERSRPDLVKKYVSQLAEIVKSTSYKKIIK
tara:strand:+ start:1274 stop:1864 length:591 start_codon:yes stop_codon:yes gene_type:complete